MDINKHPKIEDLLKVKRAEQPNEAFWEKFDLELREKTLQTFIQQEPWYHNWLNCFIRFIRSTSMAYGLVCLIGMGLCLNITFDSKNLVSNINSNDQSSAAFEEMAGSVEFVDYAVVANDTLEKDYAVEVIAINGASETYDFEADAISVAIGNTADYSDAPVYASSDTLRKSNPLYSVSKFCFLVRFTINAL